MQEVGYIQIVTWHGMAVVAGEQFPLPSMARAQSLQLLIQRTVDCNADGRAKEYDDHCYVEGRLSIITAMLISADLITTVCIVRMDAAIQDQVVTNKH